MRNPMRKITILVGTAFLLASVSGCVTVQRPTIAHTHVGHTMTAWTDTPGKDGLLNTAEREADAVASAARAAAAADGNLTTMKSHVRDMRHAIDPRLEPEGAGAGYGLRRAVEGSISHVQYAAESADVTGNIRSHAPEFAARGEAVLETIDTMIGLSDAVIQARSAGEAAALSAELPRLADAVRFGADENNDGTIQVGESGLTQMRDGMELAMARENPPYTTVERRWLFNLIRLPSGTWAFRDTGSGSSPYTGGDTGRDGGGGGGY